MTGISGAYVVSICNSDEVTVELFNFFISVVVKLLMRVSSQSCSSSILTICGVIAYKSVPETHHWTLSLTLLCNQQNCLWSGFLSHRLV